MTWAVERFVGAAAEFHALPLPPAGGAERAAWVFSVERPALVLGSTQAADVVDAEACRAAGVEVARRRSGGGAVLLVPGEVVWVDLVVPAGDPLWLDDVGRSMWWVGDAWARALLACGFPGATVHRGRPVDAPWSRLVCFAGLGAGEVTLHDRKVVGVSQRRTRSAARFQCGAYLRWDGDALIRLLTAPRPALGELESAAVSLPVGAGDLVAALLAALPR
ncbi:MAG: hypothetical protein AB7Q42_06765 [Acidimicrobiia bacterium]